MRICRYQVGDDVSVGFYFDDAVVPLQDATDAFASASSSAVEIGTHESLLDFLPPDGAASELAEKIDQWLRTDAGANVRRLPHDDVQLLVPIPRPNKLFLLAGNYAKHIEEGGGIAAERAETFPYVFMKPPTTTLTDPGAPIRRPKVSPNSVDWELELAVVIGRRAKGVSEADALNYVAGYTVVNDISDRKFRPNPDRKPRDRDQFFDWLHGKWHDSFCPCGPCIASTSEIADPQSLDMQLRVNGETKQDASTSQMVFPVAAVIEFISSFVTLEPGDIISTGTPHGVGATTGTFLQPGDTVEASIGAIGTVSSPVVEGED